MKAKSYYLPVLITLAKVSVKHKKHYCYPSQKKILSLLKTHQYIQKSRATLNRWLSYLEDDKFIHRTRRIRHDNVLGMVFLSTLYHLTFKGLKYLQLQGLNVSAHLSKLIADRNKKQGKPSSRTENATTLGDIVEAILPELYPGTSPPGT